jgi:hypothetical protein
MEGWASVLPVFRSLSCCLLLAASTVQTPEHPEDVCAVADSNLARLEREILELPQVAAPVSPGAGTVGWLNLIDQRFRLTRAEKALLSKQGLVVPARLEYSTYAWAFQDVYQSQLPLYVSVDAVFHAVYATNDSLIASLEEQQLRPALNATLTALHGALPGRAKSYPPDVARDLDVYLTVARSLLAGQPVPSALGTDDEAAALIALAHKADGMVPVTLFGRERMVDFSTYKPRGHYAAPGVDAPAGTRDLSAFFLAATWLSRLELNLVSRSCRSSNSILDARETPREATLALALADLSEVARVMDRLRALDRAWALLAGKREDISVPQLAALRQKAKIGSIVDPSAPERLREAIGNDFQRTARLHYMPEGSTVLPAIATLLGPRVVADAAMLRPLAHGETPQRYRLHAADVAYVLGHDRAKAYLAEDLHHYGPLDGQLEKARALFRQPWDGTDLYSAWLDGIGSLSATPIGALPSFMRSTAFADSRLNSTTAAFAQLRHNFVLIAGEENFEGGCQIPDGYVEPAIGAYDALIAYATRGETAFREMDLTGATGGATYFAQLGKLLRVLREIAAGELSGRALSEPERRFLSMVIELNAGTTGNEATYTGWYFDLFRDRVAEGMAHADLIASYWTSGYTDEVGYVGTRGPRLGIFVVDTGGPPRAMVGPLARAYEAVGTMENRLTDADGAKLSKISEPWAASYTVVAPRVPDIRVKQDGETGVDELWEHDLGVVLHVSADRDVGSVTIELLDHNYGPLARVTRRVGKRAVRFEFKRCGPSAVSGLGIQVGEYSRAWQREAMEERLDFTTKNEPTP